MVSVGTFPVLGVYKLKKLQHDFWWKIEKKHRFFEPPPRSILMLSISSNSPEKIMKNDGKIIFLTQLSCILEVFFRHVGKCLWSSAGSETVGFIFFSLIFKSVGREREVFVRGARLSFVSAEINEAQGRHRAAGDEPTKKYRLWVQQKISRHLTKIQK